MAKQKTTETNETTALEELAVRLDAMAAEVEETGEEKVAKSIRNAAKSARWVDKQNATRVKRVGNIVKSLQAKGLTPEEIVAQLTK